MKNKFVVTSWLLIAFLGACSPILLATIPNAVSTSSEAQSTQFPAENSIKPYDDVRFKSLDVIIGTLDRPLIETLWFNGSQIWPNDQVKAIAQEVLEAGKNPGLGVRSLHEQGITGQGVTVAIIDQNLVLDHPEYRGKIVKYNDVGTKQPSTESSMHAPAVTSLLVGETIGTAPGAQVYFAAAPSWTADAQFQADALNWIIDENAKLPADNKIRLVSVSAAPSGPGTVFTKNNAAWDEAYNRATEAGILVLDCSRDKGLTAPCSLDLNDPENPAKCTPGWPGMKSEISTDRIYIPTSLRSSAEEYNQGVFSYQFTGRGGLSWSIPYLAGVLAMGWQINPSLTNSQMVDMIFASAYVRADNAKIIDPVAFIEMVKTTTNK